MNNEAVCCEWETLKTKLQQKFPKLNHQDLTYRPGKSDEMFQHIEIKLGKTTKELAEIIAATQ
jgi:PDZ domain-containing secreted protein